MSVLFEHAVDQKIKDMKYEAILHGADPEEVEGKNQNKEITGGDNLLFGDPAEYAKMSEEERNTRSEKMMSKFKRFFHAGAKNG